MDLFNHNTAVFSNDRKYRYLLKRSWDNNKPFVMFIGLNPSTASENDDKAGNDNTITKVKKIAAWNDFGGVYMMNLFAIISSFPDILKTCDNPLGLNNLGINNDSWLKQTAEKCEKIVFAWGNFKQAVERSKEVIKMFPDPYCLAQNKNGSPKHPLYCLDESKLIKFDVNKLKF